MKKLSIITICYNEPNLEKTCESIVNQTWQDFEWIVVDGGSNEETQKIWDKYKHRIDKFISESDNGIYNAYNKGIKLAEGEYLNFMNAGDAFFYNDALKDVFNSYTEDATILYGNDNYNFGDIYKNYVETMPQKINKEFLFRSTIRHQSTFIKRDLFSKYGLYDESYKIVGDYEKWYVFLENGETFKNLPYIITDYDMSGISHNSKSAQLAYKERNEVINKYCTPDEIEYFCKNKKSEKIKYSFFENIFSLKNTEDKKHKIITILWIHFKVKRGEIK